MSELVPDQIKTHHKSQNLHVFLPSKMLFMIKEFSITVTVFLEIKHCSLVEENSPAASGYKGTEIVECGFQVNWMLSRFP